MSDPPPPALTDQNGRDRAGRWAVGNKAGTGNVTLKKVHALKTAALAAVSPEDMTSIIRGLVAQALSGDTSAARLVLEYTLGKAPATVALTGADGGAVELQWGAVEARIMTALESAPDEVRFGVALAIRGVVSDALDAE